MIKPLYLSITVAVFQGSFLFAPSACAVELVAPEVLNPGATVTPLPNGDSGDGAKLYDYTETFSFSGGPSGVLRERVLQYSDVSPAHPYGSGLYFDFEIRLFSGDVTKISLPGYSGFDVSVKQCGISNCGGSGANGVLANSASRSSDGNWISFSFGGDLSGGAHSANLQLLTNAASFSDPLATLQNGVGNTFSLPAIGPSVPEISTWAMMLLGFAGLRFAVYRGARAVPAAN